MMPQFTPQAEVVLFDLDDTLFDHRYAARCVLQDLQSRHPSLQMHPLDFLEQEDFRLLGEKHASVLSGLIDIDESRVQRVRSLFACCGEEITTDDARRLAECRQVVYRASRRAVPGAIPLLRWLKARVRIGIVTNNFLKEQQDKMDVCGLTALVDVLVTSEEIHHVKPDARIFRAALDRLNCSASAAVMVGDAWEVDVIGALNAGIRAVWFNPRGTPRPGPQAAMEIASFEPADIIGEQILGGRCPL